MFSVSVRRGLSPPDVNYKGAPHLNTFLVFVPSVVVPAGFTRDHLTAGIVFGTAVRRWQCGHARLRLWTGDASSAPA